MVNPRKPAFIKEDETKIPKFLKKQKKQQKKKTDSINSCSQAFDVRYFNYSLFVFLFGCHLEKMYRNAV